MFCAVLQERLRNALVTVSTTEADMFYKEGMTNLCGYYDGILNPQYTLITCFQPIRGQFVQLLLDDTTYFSIYEVNIYGV